MKSVCQVLECQANIRSGFPLNLELLNQPQKTLDDTPLHHLGHRQYYPGSLQQAHRSRASTRYFQKIKFNDRSYHDKP